MIEFRELALKCIFEPKYRPSAGDQLYYFLVACFLSVMANIDITLDAYEETETSRSISFKDQTGNTHNLHHSWRRDGSPTKPETYWNERSLGRFAIWGRLGKEDITEDHGPWAYAEDLYKIENN
jgi:hypothetical protein